MNAAASQADSGAGIRSVLVTGGGGYVGAVLVPQVLGRPSHWTLSVLITDQAIFQSNMPFAAALAIFLLSLSMILVGATMWINKRAEIKT